jgi:plastocyanin
MFCRHSIVPALLVAVVVSVSGQAPAEAAENTVSGNVTVLTRDGGEARQDGSGVVVFLEPADGKSHTRRQLRRPVVSQRNQEFSPRVLVVSKGAEVQFPNDDTVFHNVFSLSRPRPFDLDVYAQGEVRSVRFPNTGLVKVYCNIHPDMVTNIVVLSNDLFAITDSRGAYTIADVPDGLYRLRAWHEFGGEHSQTISVSAGSREKRDLLIQETRRVIQHLNKFGQSYTRKY